MAEPTSSPSSASPRSAMLRASGAVSGPGPSTTAAQTQQTQQTQQPRARIRFPADEEEQTRSRRAAVSRSTSSDGSGYAGIGLGHPTSSRRMNPNAVASGSSNGSARRETSDQEARRRVKSVNALGSKKSQEMTREVRPDGVRRTTDTALGNGNGGMTLKGSPESKSSRGKRSTRGLAAAAAAATASEHSRLGTLHDVFDLCK